MSTRNLTRHLSDTPADIRSAWFTGSTAIKKGQGLCYDLSNTNYGYGMAVALPSNANNMAFAGVAIRDYTATTGGQLVEFAEPGGIVDIVPLSTTTARSTHLTCCATGAPGHMQPGGFPGRGTFLALETVAAVAANTTEEGFVARSTDGTATVAADGVTLTDTGEFTNAAAGDRVIIFGGKTTADAGVAVTVGEYTIASVTSANVIVLSTACCSVASVIAYAVIRGNPTIKAISLDGPESGLVEYISTIATGAATTAFTAMVGGITRFVGGETALGDGATDDFTFTLANALPGTWKGFSLLDGIGANGDVLITVTNGEQLDGSTDLASLELDASLDNSVLQFGITKWRLIHNAGTALA